MTLLFKRLPVREIHGEESRFSHVVKHLYASKERWDMLVDLPSPPTRNARQAGCPKSALRRDHIQYPWKKKPCIDHVLNDHDRLYWPQSQEAIKSAQELGNWGLLTSTEQRAEEVIFAGSNGVLVRADKKHAEYRVLTAYRIFRGHLGDDLEEFFEACVRKMRDMTSGNREEGSAVRATLWQEEMHRELTEFGARLGEASTSASDVWRGLVLMGRVHQFGVRPQSMTMAWPLPALDPSDLFPVVEAMIRGKDEELLDELEVLCAEDEDFSTELLDLLLDIDDYAGVMCLMGRRAEGLELLQAASAMVSLAPEQTARLSQWATMRLDTLEHDAPSSTLWRAVSEGVAQLVLEALPTHHNALSDEATATVLERLGVQRAPSREHQTSEVLPFPGWRVPVPKVALMAADAGDTVLEQFTVDDVDWELYEREDTKELDIFGVVPAAPSVEAVWLEARLQDAPERVESLKLKFEHFKETLTAHLGPSRGSRSLRHKLLEQLGADGADVIFTVRVEFKT